MPTDRIYEAMAKAIAQETDTHFTLMGDANMHLATAMKQLPGMTTIHVRHEHCAVAMSMGAASATGNVGFSSVTCGPGLTQTMTALTQAARSRVPLVLFAGEVPMHSPWYSQTIDHAALVNPCGAEYIHARSAKTIYAAIQRAFQTARLQRKPVVLGVPYDLQQERMPEGAVYTPSSVALPKATRLFPDPDAIAALAERFAASEFPIIVAGQGVVNSGAEAEIEALADATGALLATTLPARGMFDHHPYSIGISGGYANEYASELAARADLVVTFGASLSSHTVLGGKFYPKAHVVQVDTAPLGLNEGIQAADDWITADAGVTARALTDALGAPVDGGNRTRTPEIAEGIRNDVGDSSEQPVAPGLLDPRRAIAAANASLPKDFDIVGGSGHQSYYHVVMKGYRPDRYHAYKAFGAIGSALSWTIGVAVKRGNGKVALFEGDGSLLMHIQELETIQRHGIKLLIFTMNDGAYGSEIHKLRRDGLTDAGAVFGHTDFAAIANGFGLRGVNVTTEDQLTAAVAEYDKGDTTMIINIHLSDQVVSPRMRETMTKVQPA